MVFGILADLIGINYLHLCVLFDGDQAFIQTVYLFTFAGGVLLLVLIETGDAFKLEHVNHRALRSEWVAARKAARLSWASPQTRRRLGLAKTAVLELDRCVLTRLRSLRKDRHSRSRHRFPF